MSGWRERGRDMGPGAFVAAALVGTPLIVSSAAIGASAGTSILWLVLLSLGTAGVLHALVLRITHGTGRDLAGLIVERLRSPLGPVFALGLVVTLVVAGGQLEGTNLLGAATGLELLFGVGSGRALLVAALACGYVLARCDTALLERVVVVLVALMGASFAGAAVLCGPDPGACVRGAMSPALPTGSLGIALALVGGPGAVFLYSAALRAKAEDDAGADRPGGSGLDLAIWIGLAGVAAVAVAVTSQTLFAAADRDVWVGPVDVAFQLESAGGPMAGLLFSVGILLAGLTSAMVVPMAASAALCGAFGRPSRVRGVLGRSIALGVLALGIGAARFGVRLPSGDALAQALGAWFLVLTAGAMVWMAVDSTLLGERRSRGLGTGLASAAAVAVTLLAVAASRLH